MKRAPSPFYFGPGAFVKKITFKKGIENRKKKSIIISVKGRDKALGNNRVETENSISNLDRKT